MKRLLSFLVILTMLCTLFVVPMTAMAADGDDAVYNVSKIEVTSYTEGYPRSTNPKFANTLLIECDVTVPETVYNSEILRINTKDASGTYAGNIRLYLTTQSQGYGLYAAYVKYNSVSYYPIALKSDGAFAGTYHVKIIFDAQKDVLLVYDINGNISKVDEMSAANNERKITADNYASLIEYKYPGEKITFENVAINLKARTITAEFNPVMTSQASVVNATFTEEVSQVALDSATYTVLDANGAAVNGAQVTATSTGANTASFAITGVSGSTDYTLSIDGLFADSGRTSDNALTYDFTTARVMADKNLYTASNKTITASESLTEGNGYKQDAFSETVVLTGNITIPEHNTRAAGTEIMQMWTTGGDSSRIGLYLGTSGGNYGLYVRYYHTNSFSYHPVAIINNATDGTYKLKVIVDPKKGSLFVYDQNDNITGRTDLATAASDRRITSESKIARIVYNVDSALDKITYNNISIDLIERGMTAELTPAMTSAASVVNATISEEITQPALDNAKYQVFNSTGTVVTGAVVTPTLVGTNGASFAITGVEGQTNYTLSIDNLFAKSGRTSDSALTCAFTTAKVANDVIIYTLNETVTSTVNYEYTAKNNKFTETVLISGKITIPAHEKLTSSYTTVYAMKTTHPNAGGEQPNIRLAISEQNGVYGLYTRYAHGDTASYYLIKALDPQTATTADVFITVDVPDDMVRSYNNATLSFDEMPIGNSAFNIFTEESYILETSKVAIGTGTIFDNFTVKLIERMLEADFTPAMTAASASINATFTENITEEALDNAVCKVLDNEGNEVSGITVTKEITGENSAKFTFTDVPGTYTLSIDKLYATSGRTSNGAIEYEFTIPVSKSVSVDAFTTVTPDEDGVTTDITLKNIGEERTVWVVMAVYGNYNMLLGYDAKDVTVGSTPATETFATTEDCSGAKEVRVFVWNNETDMIPVDRNALIWQAE